jgi:hypothetical protein
MAPQAEAGFPATLSTPDHLGEGAVVEVVT